ncbi:DUF4258 domain-containing protein [Flavobacterium subsaxonicum]|uniref:DUF4258 domain-containing protein n=1 Tax=Flavobacterium subsaxonicum WB 4.1-42 = DSM 21790 TaxID=1121898 RepID=A0A0A2MQW4_9FLAO|nr:DUF4258 domain-containing protein [Flavobacterium subsaxonicum]KGO94689.1 hypothetical protein Q766_00825 [Flavobacterium subsaxonicum WB 4.1-42 = DSM 21790]
MKFTYRLAYYLFGLLLGGMLVVFIFNKRGQDFCYLPNCRALKNIRDKGLVISKEANTAFNATGITQEDVMKSLEYGDIDFSKSNKPQKGGGKLYTIEGRTAGNEPIIIEVTNFDDRAVLVNVKKV